MRWAQDHTDGLGNADPRIPEALANRPADNWRPLLAIADAAAGKWRQRAEDAALSLAGSTDDDDKGVELLSDIRRVFDLEWLGAKALRERLIELEEAPWSEYSSGRPISPKAIANLLKPYCIKSKKERDGNRYYRADFKEAWEAYLPPIVPRGGDLSSTTSTTSEIQ
jgi:hypothetical protein